MINDYKKHDLFGKVLMQKISLKPPFKFDFPVSNQACLLYVIDGDFKYQFDKQEIELSTNYSLLLNCIQAGNQIQQASTAHHCEIVIITFYPEILKKIYEHELPLIFQQTKSINSNLSSTILNSNDLIQKYIENIVFFFDNPSFVNDDLLILKLKELILLLAQTQNAEDVQLIVSQLFSPAKYSFKQLIEANLFVQHSIEQLAELTNLSISSFKREFSKIYKDSPANYIKTKRLEKAAELLQYSPQRVSEIAYACGFNDLANFTKSFNNKYNTTPTEYRLRFTNASSS